jgi:hypothetical protein
MVDRCRNEEAGAGLPRRQGAADVPGGGDGQPRNENRGGTAENLQVARSAAAGMRRNSA